MNACGWIVICEDCRWSCVDGMAIVLRYIIFNVVPERETVRDVNALNE